MTKLSFFSVLGVSLLCSFAVVEARVGKQEERRAAELQGFGGNHNNFPLRACQGDCDHDEECEGELICFHREIGEEVPGCDGIFKNKKTDFCIPAWLHPVQTMVGLPTLKILGKNGNFDSFPLAECEGDCDSDDDCGDGLVCFSKEPRQPVPGCKGIDRSQNDYCVKSSDAATPTDPPSFSTTFKMPSKMQQTIEWASTAPSRNPSVPEYAGASQATELWLTEESQAFYADSTSFAVSRVEATLVSSSRAELGYLVDTFFEANDRADIPTNTEYLMAVVGSFNLNNLVMDLREAQPEGSMYEETLNVKLVLSPNGSTVEV